MLLFLIIAALIIAIIAVLFALQNASIILISFLAWQFQGSLALVLLLTFALGFITGLLIILPKLIKKSFTAEPQKNLEKKDEPKNNKPL
ncbi:MAG: LapA family protein [Candidatus Nealsonbacteria bacterium]